LDLTTRNWWEGGEDCIMRSSKIVRFTKCCYGNKIRSMECGHVACMGRVRIAYDIFVGKPEGKRPLGRPRRGWEDGIRIGWEGVD
jgi:hypothetical protein